MRRRTFLAGAVIMATTRYSLAQQLAKVYRIAIVHPSSSVVEMSETGGNPYYQALFGELRRLGYVEGQNLTIDRYSGEGRAERYAQLARDVVRQNPDLIITNTSYMLRHFKAATSTIPVVGITADPVAFGLVASLARPGGNITGVSIDAGLEILGKRLQLLREAIPTASRVGFLAPRLVWEGTGEGRIMREVAQRNGIFILGPGLGDPIGEPEYRRVFAAMAQERVEALIVGDQAENTTHRRLIVQLAETGRLPAIYAYREYVELGGLMAYGVDVPDLYRRMAGYVDQILKGAKPSEIPIYQATKIGLSLNLKTAKALGLTSQSRCSPAPTR
jgi:putative tryptophan/tyrosine transport system substrate-binding protein